MCNIADRRGGGGGARPLINTGSYKLIRSSSQQKDGQRLDRQFTEEE